MNIFEIEVELRNIFNEIEENEGEITPELEERLRIGETDLKQKVESYSNLIKTLSYECSAIKEEQQRLKELYDRKDKQINKLKEILVQAIDEFGETKPSGAKYYSYPTGEVSIRRSQAVEVNEELVDRVGKELTKTITFAKETNQLGAINAIDLNTIVEAIAKDEECGLALGGDDMEHIDVSLEVKVPLNDFGNYVGYNIIKEIASFTDFYKLKTSVSKTDIKGELKENGACAPNLARLVTNKSLVMR